MELRINYQNIKMEKFFHFGSVFQVNQTEFRNKKLLN